MNTHLKYILAFSFLLASCIEEGDARSYEEFAEDYEAVQNGTFTGFGFDAGNRDLDSSDTSPDIAVDTAPDPNQQCSVAGDTTTVRFENGTGQDAELVWINYECRPVLYGQFAAGASAQQQTFVGHVWQLVADGKVLSERVIEASAANIVFE